MVVYWLEDCVKNRKITVASNFEKLISSHTGNLKTIAKSQSEIDKIGELNGLEQAQMQILQVSNGASSIHTGGGTIWQKTTSIHEPGYQVNSALSSARTNPKVAIIHLEWDGGVFSSGGAHSIGVIRNDAPGGSTFTYTVFDPNYGLFKAYGSGKNTISGLLKEITKNYGVERFMVMPF